MRTWSVVSAFLAMSAVPASGLVAAQNNADPFAFLHPTVILTSEDRQRLDRQEPIVRILPASGHELATIAVSALDAGPDALMASVEDIVGLKKSSLVPEIGRFSRHPRLEDLQGLTLDNRDIDEIANCRPGDCDLKLSPDEIARLHEVATGSPHDIRANVEVEFRQIILERTLAYLLRGILPEPQNFSILLGHCPFLENHMPKLVAYLRGYPDIWLPGAESFLYWSKEVYARKPIITVTDVTILRGSREMGLPEVIIASRDVFSSRYTGGSLALTFLVADPDDPSHRYLIYLNRTWVDGLHWFWRPFIDHRIRTLARNVLATACARIERYSTQATADRFRD